MDYQDDNLASWKYFGNAFEICFVFTTDVAGEQSFTGMRNQSFRFWAWNTNFEVHSWLSRKSVLVCRPW
jgi:hypothetical protein